MSTQCKPLVSIVLIFAVTISIAYSCGTTVTCSGNSVTYYTDTCDDGKIAYCKDGATRFKAYSTFSCSGSYNDYSLEDIGFSICDVDDCCGGGSSQSGTPTPTSPPESFCNAGITTSTCDYSSSDNTTDIRTHTYTINDCTDFISKSYISYCRDGETWWKMFSSNACTGSILQDYALQDFDTEAECTWNDCCDLSSQSQTPSPISPDTSQTPSPVSPSLSGSNRIQMGSYQIYLISILVVLLYSII